ncbi:unnamed protein product, partial [Rotaria magnacalcarata]
YTGQYCDIQIDHCTSQPCQNNGVCINTITGFTCICLSIYTGTYCSIATDPCLSKSCVTSNTSDCNNNNNNNTNYRCSCRAGFTASLCEQTMNYCSSISLPCKNGGTCIDTINGYVCQCGGFYQGSDCSIPVDPCSNNPC